MNACSSQVKHDTSIESWSLLAHCCTGQLPDVAMIVLVPGGQFEGDRASASHFAAVVCLMLKLPLLHSCHSIFFVYHRVIQNTMEHKIIRQPGLT